MKGTAKLLCLIAIILGWDQYMLAESIAPPPENDFGWVKYYTQLDFPEGTKLMEYSRADGIDVSLTAKVRIPEQQKEQFLRNSVFQKENETKPSLNRHKGLNWWKPEGLEDKKIYSSSHQNEGFGLHHMEVHIGKEDDSYVAYIYWFTV